MHGPPPSCRRVSSLMCCGWSGSEGRPAGMTVGGDVSVILPFLLLLPRASQGIRVRHPNGACQRRPWDRRRPKLCSGARSSRPSRGRSSGWPIGLSFGPARLLESLCATMPREAARGPARIREASRGPAMPRDAHEATRGPAKTPQGFARLREAPPPPGFARPREASRDPMRLGEAPRGSDVRPNPWAVFRLLVYREEYRCIAAFGSKSCNSCISCSCSCSSLNPRLRHTTRKADLPPNVHNSSPTWWR